MGVYLRLQAKLQTIPEVLNRLWIEFSGEEVEKEFPMNFYADKCGYTLHFYTQEDLEKDVEYFCQNRADLGFRPDMTFKEGLKLYKQLFPQWSKIGYCEIKISGGHYCFHSLEKVRDFVKKYEKYVKMTEETKGDLQGYIDLREAVYTSRYCLECWNIAQKLGIELPIFHGLNHKNPAFQIGSEAEVEYYNQIVHKVDDYLQKMGLIPIKK